MGRVQLRRLSRTEYANTVRDLLGDVGRPADGFPRDDTSFGFDHIDDVLGMAPVLVEKYDAAAEAMAREAWSADVAPAQLERLEAEAVPHTLGIPGGTDFWRLNGNGSIDATFDFGSSGPFTLSARAAGDVVHGVAPRMLFRLDGQLVAEFDVAASADTPAVYQKTVEVTAGRHTFSVGFDNYLWDDSIADPMKRERALLVDWLQLQRDAWAAPFSQARLRVCDEEVEGHLPCARRILERFARRAWRRTVSPEEVERLVSLVTLAEADGDDFGTGIQLAVQAVLLSPHFLFHLELDGAPDTPDTHPVSDEELASRLSYFLWSSTPDDTLLELAAEGRLSKPEVLDAQVRRMLADAKADALVESFAAQWLQFRAVPSREPSAVLFPDVDEALKEAMQEQTARYFREFLREDRSALDLLDADFTYVDDRLAAHAGLPLPGSAHLTRVEVTDARRRGLLTQPGLLMLTSHPDETSPVVRGKWVLGQLLCAEPPPPPPSVPALPPVGSSSLSKRQQLEQHRADPACSGCHAVMDPVGFGLENFDAVGRWRERDEAGFPVDAVGVLPGDVRFNGPAELAALLKADPRLPACLARNLYIYALARSFETSDRCHLDGVVRTFEQRDYRLSELVRRIATSRPFTHR